MSLNDREHVEAVAIIRRLLDQCDREAASMFYALRGTDEREWPELDRATRNEFRSRTSHDAEVLDAAECWLLEQHPDTAEYLGALRDYGPPEDAFWRGLRR